LESALRVREQQKVWNLPPKPPGRKEEGKIVQYSALSAALREIGKSLMKGQNILMATNGDEGRKETSSTD
jgi:hypothetical protein